MKKGLPKNRKAVIKMLRDKFPVLTFLLVLLSACAGTQPTVKPALHDADLYPNAQTTADLTIAVDEISDGDRSRRYFGRDLTRDDVLPIRIIFTNRGENPVTVKPSDVLLFAGDSVIDAVPPEKAVKGEPLALAMQEKIVPPGENYQGILFYRVKKKEPGLYGKVERLFLDKVKMRIVATDQQSGERIHFGPYSLSGL